MENIARMPYFYYLSALYLYKTLGMRRHKNIERYIFLNNGWIASFIYYEGIGGNDNFFDRIVVQGKRVYACAHVSL